MADHDPYGLTSHLVDDQTWEALRENNLPDPDPHAAPGAVVLRPRPIYAAPAPLQAGMTRLALLRWKEDKTKYSEYLKAPSELRHALLQSIGAHNTMTLERAVGDIMDVQPMEIYANMIAQRGVFTTTDIEALEVKLLKPLSSLSNFEPHCAAFRLNLQSLDREQAMPIPQTVYKIFKQTLKNFPQFSPYQPHFDIAFPQREDRLFEDYYRFIQPHLPTISANTSPNPFAGSAQQKSSTNTVSKSDFDALKSQLDSLTAILAATTSHFTQLPLPQPLPPSHSAPKKYCHVHGLNHSHVGMQCLVMKSKPAQYTPAHIQSSSPSDVAGGSSFVQKTPPVTNPPCVHPPPVSSPPLPFSHPPPPPFQAPRRQ